MLGIGLKLLFAILGRCSFDTEWSKDLSRIGCNGLLYAGY
jgi:hypothetical protein